MNFIDSIISKTIQSKKIKDRKLYSRECDWFIIDAWKREETTIFLFFKSDSGCLENFEVSMVGNF